jgi:hypothetical protein
VKLLLASPTYGPVDPQCVTAIRAAVMTAGRHGTDWLGDLAPDRMTYSDARNVCAKVVAESPSLGMDGVVWVDSDMVPEPDSILKLVVTAQTHSFDFLSGVYHQRKGKHCPTFYRSDDAGLFLQSTIYPDNTIFPVDGCGFGFCFTSTKLILAIKSLPDFSEKRGGWFPDHHYGAVSEDLGFCKYATSAGFQLFVNSAIQVGHLGDSEVITRAHYLKALAGPEGTTAVVVG